jgi:uncharacterized protein (DUF58 family)
VGCLGTLTGLCAVLIALVWLAADPSGAAFGLIGGAVLMFAIGGAIGVLEAILAPRPTRH